MPQPLAPIEIQSRSHLMCEACRVTMKLYGIETHPTIDRADLLTYVCPCCDEVQTTVMPNSSPLHAGEAFDAETTGLLGSTFDAAWKTAVASDSLLANTQHEGAARETLARCIIEMIRQGETHPSRLTEEAVRTLLKH